jgi:hypothetical protein
MMFRDRPLGHPTTMTEHDQPDDLPRPDDPATRSTAEELDEDELAVDPLEAGMDPPEHWSAADRRGTTPRERRRPAPLDERLAAEQSDVDDQDPVPDDVDAATETPAPDATDERWPGGQDYHERQGTSADVAGGSVADEMSTPPRAE